MHDVPVIEWAGLIIGELTTMIIDYVFSHSCQMTSRFHPSLNSKD